MSGCRIGNVKLRNGADLLRFPKPSRDESQQYLVERAAIMASHFAPGELAGYVVFAWSTKGGTSIGYHWNDRSNVRARLVPSFIADAIRDRMITEGDWGRD
jgi:hypothetical protein